MSPRRKPRRRTPALAATVLGVLVALGVAAAFLGPWRSHGPAPTPPPPKLEFPGPPGTEISLRGTDGFSGSTWWTRLRRAENGDEVIIGVDSGPRALNRRAEVHTQLPAARVEELWTELERLDCWKVESPPREPVPTGSLTELYLHRGDRERRLAYTGEKENPVSRLVGLIEGFVGAPDVWQKAERDVGALQKVLDDHADEVRRCAQGGAGSQVRLRWVIDPKTRHARDVTVVSGNPDSNRVSCLREALATWTFPRPEVVADAPVEYDFRL